MGQVLPLTFTKDLAVVLVVEPVVVARAVPLLEVPAFLILEILAEQAVMALLAAVVVARAQRVQMRYPLRAETVEPGQVIQSLELPSLAQVAVVVLELSMERAGQVVAAVPGLVQERLAEPIPEAVVVEVKTQLRLSQEVQAAPA
jgi:hypothetical protein